MQPIALRVRIHSSLNRTFDKEKRHRLRLWLIWLCTIAILVWVASRGLPYYLLDVHERAHSPLHAAMRPSGTIGLRLGIAGLVLFSVIFLYAIRKRVSWLNRLGMTRHWLDFHVFCGITAPIVITLHSSFKLRGLAGVAYWIMMAVALSGFIGRYLYSQIPRSLTAAELSFKDIEVECDRLAKSLQSQNLLTENEIGPLLKLPSREQVAEMPLLSALLMMLRMDIVRPFRVSGLRRSFLSPSKRVLTLGGLLSSGNHELEGVIAAVRGQSWLSAKMLFLTRMQETFHLWHVVHRPFSYSFVVLVAIHITVAMLFGYY
jgi:hypothetical protein